MNDFHQKLTAFRRDLHRHPELGFEETRTNCSGIKTKGSQSRNVFGRILSDTTDSLSADANATSRNPSTCSHYTTRNERTTSSQNGRERTHATKIV